MGERCKRKLDYGDGIFYCEAEPNFDAAMTESSPGAVPELCGLAVDALDRPTGGVCERDMPVPGSMTSPGCGV